LDKSKQSALLAGEIIIREKNMTKIWIQDDITSGNITSHLKDSGFIPMAIDKRGIWLHTITGIAYCISILEDEKFIRFWTFLPLDRNGSRESKLALEHRLNAEIFLPVFSLESDDNLSVSYLMPYQMGLIAGQFMAIVNRFSRLLDVIVESYDENQMIDFSLGKTVYEIDESDRDVTGLRPAGVLLN
jgi:hypothetical protein